jgi:hypothetical protein
MLFQIKTLLQDSLDFAKASLRQRIKELNPQVSSAIDSIRMNQPPKRGSRQILEIYSESPWVQAVTKKIGERVASTEWLLFAQTGGNGNKHYIKTTHRESIARKIKRAPFKERKRLLRKLQAKGQLKEITNHPALDLLASGSPGMTGSASRRLTQISRDLVGEAFWVLDRDGLNIPVAYWYMPPHWVTELPGPGRDTYGVSLSGQQIKIPAGDVIWFREPDPAKPYSRGTGLGMALGDEIETDEYAAKFIKTFFANSARPELLIYAEGEKKENLQRAKLEFENSHRGYQRAHRSWWMNKKIEVKELTRKFTDMELVSLRQSERDTIIAVFGVPPEQLGIVTSSNRATAHESERIMATSVLVPRLEAQREQLQVELIDDYDDRLILDFESPIPEDKESKLKAMQAAPYTVTRGEWRIEQGQDHRGKGDEVHIMPLNLIEVPAPAVSKSKSIENKILTEGQVPLILDSLNPDRIAAEIDPVWKSEMEKWGQEALDSLGVDVSFNMLNPKVVKHLESVVGEKITQINDTTKLAIRDTLVDGVKEGEGFRELAGRIRDVFQDATKRRSIMIARTETVRSASFASENAWQQSQIVWGKRWNVVPDGGRHDKAGYGGKTAEIGTNFEFGAPYPGGFGDPAQDINCRCALTPVISAEDARLHFDAWQKNNDWAEVEARRMAWEKIAIAAYNRGFNAQLKDALKALEGIY